MFCFLLYMIMYIYNMYTYEEHITCFYYFRSYSCISYFVFCLFVSFFLSLFVSFFLSLLVCFFVCLFVRSFVVCLFVSKQFQSQPDRDWLISASGQSDYGWCRIACPSTDNIAAFASSTQWLYFMSYTSRLVTYLLKFCWDASIESIYA